jgi:hypothetical protein
MADKKVISEAGQKQVEQLNEQLDLVEDQIINIGRRLNDDIKNKLSDLKDDTRAWTEAFANGENVISKVKNKLLTTQKDLNKLTLKRNDLETLFNRAQILGKSEVAARIQQSINQNKLNTQYLESVQTQLIKLQQIAEEEKKIVEEKKKENNLLEQGKKYYKDNIASQFTLLALLKLIVNAALAYNKASVEIGKNFGYGTEQADRLASSLIKIARNSDNINVTFKSLNEAMNELSTTTGFVAEYSKDTLETQVMLTKQLGLTGEEAAGVYKFSVLTGKSSKETYTSMKNTFVAMRNQLGVGIPFRATMAEIAKISGQIAASLGYNPDRIAKAVIQAKALGTTLEQTKNQADFLLDFESSIEAELKAELITGQALNLERARALALSNDLAGVAEEIANQGMTAAKYGQMNAIAQKSFAASVGLTSDQLSDQLQKRELALASGKSLAQLNKEETDEAAKRQSIQERFNVAIEKMQDLVGGLVAGPLGQFLDLITSILNNTTALAAIIGGTMVLNLMKIITVMKQAKKISYGAAVVEIIKSAYQSIGGLPGVGMILAGAAAAAGISYLASQSVQSVEDGIAPSSKGPFTITDNYGATAITAAGDGLAVSPNINRGGEQSNNMNNNALLAKLDQIASRPSIAYIQGERPFANALGKQSQLFTSGMQNQSKFA